MPSADGSAARPARCFVPGRRMGRPPPCGSNPGHQRLVGATGLELATPSEDSSLRSGRHHGIARTPGQVPEPSRPPLPRDGCCRAGRIVGASHGNAGCQKSMPRSVPLNTGQHAPWRLSRATRGACRTRSQAGARSSWPQAAVHAPIGCLCDDVPRSRPCRYLHQMGGGPAATRRPMRASRRPPSVAKSRTPGFATCAWAAVGRYASSASGWMRGSTAARLHRCRVGLMNVLDLSRAAAHF